MADHREPTLDEARALREADRRANLAPTAELLDEAPLQPDTRAAVRGFRLRARLRDLPVIGSAARRAYRMLKGGGS